MSNHNSVKVCNTYLKLQFFLGLLAAVSAGLFSEVSTLYSPTHFSTLLIDKFNVLPYKIAS